MYKNQNHNRILYTFIYMQLELYKQQVKTTCTAYLMKDALNPASTQSPISNQVTLPAAHHAASEGIGHMDCG